jgi:hypothetical protein
LRAYGLDSRVEAGILPRQIGCRCYGRRQCDGGPRRA